MTPIEVGFLAVAVLSCAVSVLSAWRSVPSRLVSRVQNAEETAREALKLTEGFKNERIARQAEFDAFADRCEELLETASNKQRRAAASASRAARSQPAPGGPEAEPHNEEQLLANLRKLAGLH